MRIAVYTIALNEEAFVRTWYESAKEADLLLIGDTGSTDNTVLLAKSLGIEVVDLRIKPWRFDMARNALLAHIPLDVDMCIALDMDEVLVDGWRSELERIGHMDITRPRYKYTWSWNEDGTPGLQYGGDKIHARSGYRWKHPVHEVVTPYGITEEQAWTDLEIHHHPDPSKSRSMYLPMLAMAVAEDPYDDRNRFYYGRDLCYAGQHVEAAIQLNEYLKLGTWQPERSLAMRLLAQCDAENAEAWLHMAHEEYPSRETACALALHAYRQENWEACSFWAGIARTYVIKPLEYLCEPDAWSWLPWDLAAIAHHHLGRTADAMTCGIVACEQAPLDQRLKDNLVHYRRRHAEATSAEMS